MSEELNTSAEMSDVAEPIINEQATEPTNEPVNAGGGEVAPSQVDEKQVQTQEENAKYATIRREYEAKIATESQKAIDAEYDRLYGESHGIHNKADYDKAVQAEEEQSRINEYVQNNIPEEYARELVESKKFREQFEGERQTRAKQEQINKQYLEFTEAYKDVDPTSIKQEVWDQVNNHGIPLKVAYASQQENAILKAKIAEYEGKFKAQETNQNNAQSSTGSVTGNGVADIGFISSENFEANKGNQRWVMNNLSKIQESRVKW